MLSLATVSLAGSSTGSYTGAGYLLATLDTSGTVTNYARWLDLDEAIARTVWSQGGATFNRYVDVPRKEQLTDSGDRETFCPHPILACVQYVNSTSPLPPLTYAFSVGAETGLPIPNVTCFDNSTLSIRGYVSDPGMLYEILAQVEAPGGAAACSAVPGSSPPNATLSINGTSEAWITWVGDTNYDMAAGNAAFNYSFQGPDPHNNVVNLLASANLKSTDYDSILAEHIADYQSIMGPFSLSLGQIPDFSTPTDQILALYQTNIGNTYLEWLIFNYGRYLLASSARGTLPANLQGKWADGLANPWSAGECSLGLDNICDNKSMKQTTVSTHRFSNQPACSTSLLDANINVQMNYWFAEMTNMDVVVPLFDYIEV